MGSRRTRNAARRAREREARKPDKRTRLTMSGASVVQFSADGGKTWTDAPLMSFGEWLGDE